MLRKLLKYDMLSIFRFWWIIAVALVVTTVADIFIFKYLEVLSDRFVFLTILAAVFFIISIFAIITSLLVVEIFVFKRFRDNLFTDEAYLTFTLPASRKQILFSKTLNAFFWISLHTILVVGFFFTFYLFCNGSHTPAEIFSEIGKAISSIWDFFGWWTILYAVTLCLILLLSQLFLICVIQFCITAPSLLLRKGKLIAGIGIYYGINTLSSWGSYMFIEMIVAALGINMFQGLEALSHDMSCLFLFLFLLLMCIFFATISAFWYFASLNIIEKKLNLA